MNVRSTASQHFRNRSPFTVNHVRHHKNSSRLVRTLVQLLEEKKSDWKKEFCNNVLDECGTVLQKDRADKSSSIYLINNREQLEVYAYNRIEFSSSRQRKFSKGEGFAGGIWASGESMLINDIEDNDLFTGEFAPTHEYNSILGIPIKVGNKIYGVLNIQSEKKNGFSEDDLRTVVFYADMCALAHYYDIINMRGGD